MPRDDIAHFTRDPGLAASIADEFGGGSGNAEHLIGANEERYSQELVAAQLLPAESGQPEHKRNKAVWTRDDNDKDVLAFTHEDVADAADLDEELLLSYDIHGDYLVYQFSIPTGRKLPNGRDDVRIGKDVLLVENGSLSAPEREETPQRAALRAHAEASRKVRDARTEAEDIVADAEQKAEAILREAKEKADKDAAEASEKARAKPSEAEPEPEAKSGSKSESKSGSKSGSKK